MSSSVFIFWLYLSDFCFSVVYIFIYSTKILRTRLQFCIVLCHNLFQVFHYLSELAFYWILFVFMFRMLLPHFRAVGLLGWEDILPYTSLSLPSLFCIYLLGHPKCFLSSRKIYLTHNRCGARWGEKVWRKNTGLSTSEQALSASKSTSIYWCKGRATHSEPTPSVNPLQKCFALNAHMTEESNVK